ncbi:MAG: chorismate--pyruvate lyase family protein [Solirubrobacteraceae bacterium]
MRITQLEPFLRGLLFTDGTVSRALEAHTLRHVVVEALEQGPCAMPAAIAAQLDAVPAEECLRRRIVMRLAGSRPVAWAESHVVPARLPREFLARLGEDPQGIGGSLQQLKLESRRELLWFGLGRRPSWARPGTPLADTLTRCYRVLSRTLPALLICESFSVELRSGVHRMPGCGDDAHEDESLTQRPLEALVDDRPSPGASGSPSAT